MAWRSLVPTWGEGNMSWVKVEVWKFSKSCVKGPELLINTDRYQLFLTQIAKLFCWPQSFLPYGKSLSRHTTCRSILVTITLDIIYIHSKSNLSLHFSREDLCEPRFFIITSLEKFSLKTWRACFRKALGATRICK